MPTPKVQADDSPEALFKSETLPQCERSLSPLEKGDSGESLAANPTRKTPSGRSGRMNKVEFQVGVRDGLIVVMDPASRFYAIYSKPPDQPRLILECRGPTKDHSKER